MKLLEVEEDRDIDWRDVNWKDWIRMGLEWTLLMEGLDADVDRKGRLEGTLIGRSDWKGWTSIGRVGSGR